MMRVLSVRQPWAWAIVHGGKDVENRRRNLAGGYRGLVAIQVSMKGDPDPYASGGGRELDEAQGAYEWGEREFTPPWWRDPGRIVGVVDLVDVHHFAACFELENYSANSGELVHQSVGACSPWAERDDVFHLKLADPRPLTESMPWRGALGLRELPADVEAEIVRRLP